MKIITDAPSPSALITAPKNSTGNDDMSSLSKNDLFAMLVANENKSTDTAMKEDHPADTNQSPEQENASSDQQMLMTPTMLDMFRRVMLYQEKQEDKQALSSDYLKADKVIDKALSVAQDAQLPIPEPGKVSNEMKDQAIYQLTQQTQQDNLQAMAVAKLTVPSEKAFKINSEEKPAGKITSLETNKIPVTDKPKAISVSQINKMMADMQVDSDKPTQQTPSFNTDNTGNTQNYYAKPEQPVITSPVVPAIHHVDSMNKSVQIPTGTIENKTATIQLKGPDHSTLKLSMEWPAHIAMDSTGKETYHANIKIYPPEMGKIEARIRMDNNRANLIITTENNQVTDILKANMSILKDHFTQSHLNLDKIDIQTSLSFQGQEQKQQLKENQTDERMPAEREMQKPTQLVENKEKNSDSTIDTYI